MNSSNPDIKVKKRYNKFMAFLLANGMVATVLYIVMLAGGIANGSEIDAASFGVIFITLFITVIITLLIFKTRPRKNVQPHGSDASKWALSYLLSWDLQYLFSQYLFL